MSKKITGRIFVSINGVERNVDDLTDEEKREIAECLNRRACEAIGLVEVKNQEIEVKKK